MPMGDRFPRPRRRRSGRRLIRDGEEYTMDEEREGRIELEEPDPDPDPPPERTRGEPWGWPDDEEHRDRPRGWPGPQHSHDDPGPYDGSWGQPGEVRDGTD